MADGSADEESSDGASAGGDEDEDADDTTEIADRVERVRDILGSDDGEDSATSD